MGGVNLRPSAIFIGARTMSSESPIPSTARCLGCGYFLRGLPTPVCPECGRAFDPADASTYDLRPPDWRRRRKIKRIALAVAIGLALALFAPRNLLQGQLTFRCRTCGEAQTTHRWELLPPRWIPFRYPGFDRTTIGPPAPDVVPPCTSHAYRVDIRFQTRVCLSATGMAPLEEGQSVIFNGFVTSPATARGALHHVMHPDNTGIGVGRSLVP